MNFGIPEGSRLRTSPAPKRTVPLGTKRWGIDPKPKPDAKKPAEMDQKPSEQMAGGYNRSDQLAAAERICLGF